jgi:hypothetical protein
MAQPGSPRRSFGKLLEKRVLEGALDVGFLQVFNRTPE